MKTVKPKINPEELNFNYLKEESGVVRELAFYYEYSRHSNAIKGLIESCRENSLFSNGKMGPVESLLGDSLMREVFHLSKLIRVRILCFLSDRPEFPEKPFVSFKGTSSLERYGADELLIKEPVDTSNIPLRNLETLVRLAGLQSSLPNLNPTFKVVSVDWNYTNKEIAASFEKAIQKLRPQQFPEPPKAGRYGRSIGAGVEDKLRQLAAYRLDLAGVDYATGRKLIDPSYQSNEGWKKGVLTAKSRIENLTKCPI